MNSNGRFWIVVALLVGPLTSHEAARGQGPVMLLPPVECQPAPVRQVTLADLESLALSHNPTIPAAAAGVMQQQGLMQQATLYPNPSAGYLRSDNDQPGHSRTEGVFFSQEIVVPGKIQLARLSGQNEVAHSDWQHKAQQYRVLNDVRIRYFEALGAREALVAAGELEALAKEGAETAKKLLDIRQGSRPDVLQAEIQWSAMKSSRDDAQHRYVAAMRQLANVVGVSELNSAVVVGQLDVVFPHLDFDRALERTLRDNPLLHGQQAMIQASQYDLKLARLQAVPNVNVQVVAQRDSFEKYSSVNALVSLPIPVFNRNQGNILNAQGQLLQHQKEAERLRLALMDQMATTFRQYESLRSQVNRLRTEVLPRAKENLELTTKAYELRQFDFPRLLAARQTYFQAKFAAIDGLVELHKSAVEIDGMLLTGGLNPAEVGTTLQTQMGSGIRANILQQLQEQRGPSNRNLPGAVQAGER